MKFRRRCVIDEAVGETRAAVYEGKKLVELYVRRWSESNQARTGDVFSGVVRYVDKYIGAAFVDLGAGPQGFLKFTMAPKAPRFKEGMRIEVEITREAEADKGPVLKYLRLVTSEHIGRVSGDDLHGFINKRFDGKVSFEMADVSSVEGAVERKIAIPGGGDIAIDFTRALVAVDVDKGPANSGMSVSEAVVPMLAHQLRLRGIGGLIIIDFPNLRQPKQRKKLHEQMQQAFIDDPHPVKITPMSRFGVVEMTRAKMGRSLDHILNDQYCRPTIETQALRALRRLEREGRANGGAKLTLFVPDAVKSWLVSEIIDWRAAMSDRIGARFILETGAVMDVKVDR